MSSTSPTASPATTRSLRRSAISDRLLDALESLVERHRALALHPDETGLHAELIAAEVAHELAVARSALRRNPPLAPVQHRGSRTV
jgi:hypothetical protein